jgi:hypothetical protein
MALVGNLPWREASAYLAAQFAGAFAAVATARLMFRKAHVFRLPSSPPRGRSIGERDGRYLWAAVGDLQLRPLPAPGGCLFGGSLCRRGLLIHGFDLVRKPCGHASALCQ